MKRLMIVLSCAFLLSFYPAHSQVAINTSGNPPASSALLDLSSTELGVLFPRMTAAQRDDITDPATGLMVFVTDNNSIYVYDGSSWIEGIGGSGGSGAWTVSGNDTYTSVSGNAGIGISSPNNKLHVYSEASAALRLQGDDGWIGMELADETAAQTAVFGFMNNGNGITSLDITNRKSGGSISFYTSDDGGATMTSKAVLSNDGNFGIGTTNPTYDLEIARAGSGLYESASARMVVYSDGSEAKPIINFLRSHSPVMDDQTSAAAVTQDGDILGRFAFNGIRVNGGGGSASGAGWFEMIQKGATTSSGVPGQFQIITADGIGGRDTRFVVSPEGYVGIGTIAPAEMLDIEGNIDLNGNQVKNMVIENRTSDPASPAVGQIWIRTDL